MREFAVTRFVIGEGMVTINVVAPSMRQAGALADVEKQRREGTNGMREPEARNRWWEKQCRGEDEDGFKFMPWPHEMSQ